MSLLRHASIRTKVALAPAFAILCLLIVAGMGLWASDSADRTLAQINTQRMPALGVAADFERGIATLHASVNQSLVWEGAGAKAETVAALDKRIAQDFEALGKVIEAQASHPAWSEADRATLKRIAQAFAKFKTTALETIDIKSTGLGAASGFITRSESSYAELSKLIGDLVKRQHESTQREVAQAGTIGSKSRIATVIALAIAVLLSALGTLWCARLIARPLGRAVAILQSVATGDFTHRLPVESRDEVGQASAAINQVVDSMQAALRDVRAAASHAALASQQLSAASDQLSNSAQQQAASLEETAASLEQLTGTVKQNADNARQASDLAVGSHDIAGKGGEVVALAMAAMEEINRSSTKIADIITTIDEIAFQTNLLALNAAVEAARAGEQGRGFAVVAAEVRNLAQRAAAAAREIKGLIQDTVGKVETGSALVTRSGATLGEIVTSVKRVADIIAEIAAASAEQTMGIDQVNESVTQMDHVVQSNAAETEELSSTAQTLATQAEQLRDLVGRFRTGDDGAVPSARGDAGARHAPAASSAASKKGPRAPSTSRGIVAPRAALLIGAATGAGPARHESDGFEEF